MELKSQYCGCEEYDVPLRTDASDHGSDVIHQPGRVTSIGRGGCWYL